MGSNAGMFGDFESFLQQFQKFQSTFTGNPEEEVRKLITSGKISQQQLNQVQQMAHMLQGFFGKS